MRITERESSWADLLVGLEGLRLTLQGLQRELLKGWSDRREVI